MDKWQTITDMELNQGMYHHYPTPIILPFAFHSSPFIFVSDI